MFLERCVQAIYIVPDVYYLLSAYTMYLKSQSIQLIRVQLQRSTHQGFKITYKTVNKDCDQNSRQFLPEAPIWVFCTYHLTVFPTIEGSDGCILFHRIAKGCALAPIVSTFSILEITSTPLCVYASQPYNAYVLYMIPDVEVFSRSIFRSLYQMHRLIIYADDCRCMAWSKRIGYKIQDI